jgi:cytochrome c oxidase subunit 2
MWNFPLFPERASTNADKVDLVFLGELAVVLFFTFFICFLILFFAIRYRRGSKVDRSNPPRSSHVIEAIWIGVPLFLSMLMFLGGVIVFFDLFAPPKDAFRIDVVGKQWMWKIQHPEGKREINELHVPVGRAVVLRMISEDVIHSFFIPDFRIKQDVLPGRYTSLWFRATKPGRYHLFCAEYCGTEHSKMIGWVEVMEPSDYERWLTESTQDAPSTARQGRELFVQYHCAGCHGDSATVKAPRLEGIYGRPVPIMQGKDQPPKFVIADDRYIRSSILLPASQVVAGYEPIMPSYSEIDGKKQIPEEDLLKILEYIRSIGPKGTEETGP